MILFLDLKIKEEKKKKVEQLLKEKDPNDFVLKVKYQFKNLKNVIKLSK